MSAGTIQFLLKEYETEVLHDRRSVRRKPFVRPVVIRAGRNRDEIHHVFSRDISSVGIGVISQVNWAENTVAKLSIESIAKKRTVTVEAQARWTEPYGEGWYITGWKFLNANF